MGYKREAARGIGTGYLLLIIFIVLGLITGAGLWALDVATSGVKGKGDAVKINNSAENWTAKQAFFHEKYNAVLAADKKIGTFKALVDADTTDKTALTNYTSMQSQCQNYVSEYNAESSKFLSQDWKDPELPTVINESNSKTDCK
jgi:hypothetical protein